MLSLSNAAREAAADTVTPRKQLVVPDLLAGTRVCLTALV